MTFIEKLAGFACYADQFFHTNFEFVWFYTFRGIERREGGGQATILIFYFVKKNRNCSSSSCIIDTNFLSLVVELGYLLKRNLKFISFYIYKQIYFQINLQLEALAAFVSINWPYRPVRCLCYSGCWFYFWHLNILHSILTINFSGKPK